MKIDKITFTLNPDPQAGFSRLTLSYKGRRYPNDTMPDKGNSRGAGYVTDVNGVMSNFTISCSDIWSGVWSVSTVWDHQLGYGFLGTGDRVSQWFMKFDKPINVDELTFTTDADSRGTYGSHAPHILLELAGKTVFTHQYNNLPINTKPVVLPLALPIKYFIKNDNKYYVWEDFSSSFIEADVATSEGVNTSKITKSSIASFTPPVYLVSKAADIGETDLTFNSGVKIKLEDAKCIIRAKGDVDILNAKEVFDFLVTFTKENNINLRMAISFDSGNTWNGFNRGSGKWQQINLDTELKTRGLTSVDLASLTATDLASLVAANKFRFAYGLFQTSPLDNLSLTSTSFKMKLEGLYQAQLLNTNYKYARGTDFMEITFVQAGDYIVNYSK